MSVRDDLPRLLANLAPLQRWAALHAQAHAFNVFSILREESDEVGLHTVFLEALLDPAGAHGCGSALLELFLAELGVVLQDSADMNGAVVERERRTAESGQIDLLIELPRPRLVVVVENKIHAGDQERQLERYHQRAVQRAGHAGRTVIFYLTLHGAEPCAQSLGELPLEKVSCVSYREHILRWLDRCLEKAARHPALRETLAQYEELIKKLTGQSMSDETRDQVIGLLAEGNNAELAQMIVGNWDHLKWRTTWAFWREMEVAVRRWQPLFPELAVLEANKFTDERLTRLYFWQRKKDYDFGLTIRLGRLPGSASDEVCLCLFNSDEGSEPFFGLAVLREGKWEGNQRAAAYDALAAQVASFFHPNPRDDWWIGWRYFRSVPLNLVDYANAETLALVNPVKRVATIETLCAEMESCLTECGMPAFMSDDARESNDAK